MYMMAKMWGDPKKVPDSPEALWRLPGDADTGVTEADTLSKVFSVRLPPLRHLTKVSKRQRMYQAKHLRH